MNETDQIFILLVDDRPDNLLALTAVLSGRQYQLIEAQSGPQALALLEEHEYAVILLDVQMPGMDGFETARRIRLHPKARSTPIIFITASIENSGRVYEGYEAGAVDYIFKPFDPAVLRSKVAIFAELYAKKQELLRQSEMIRQQQLQDMDSFLEYALDAVIGMNENGYITFWNQEAESVFGWSKNEVMGKKLSEVLIPERYRLAHEAGRSRFLNTGEGPILRKRIEIEAIHKSGQEFAVELTVIPMKRGEHYQFSAFIRDISERKRIEQERKAEQEKLRKAIQARDEFIGICSHELKTPITSMKLQFQLAARQLKNQDSKVFSHEATIKRISNTNNQLERMSKLIDNMLDVSKIASGKLFLEKTTIDVTALVDDVLSHFEEQLEYLNIEVRYKRDEEPIFMNGDKIRLEQVFTNLLTNAIKYGDEKPISLELHQVGDFLSFTVTDQGLGIKKENLERIFYRYERAIAASSISGLGLGLYITKQIVEAHGGHITVASTEGKGSTFSITLPALPAHPEKFSSTIFQG